MDDTVEQAVAAFCKNSAQRPDGRAVTAALLQLERAAKRAKVAIPLKSLLGTWRLCFNAGKGAKFEAEEPAGNGFYIPKLAIARLAFTDDSAGECFLAISNELHVGPLQVHFTGPARYPGRKNLLAFDFTQLQVSCFGLKVYQGKVESKKRAGKPFQEIPMGQLPFFAFFAAQEQYLAARGRGGGLAIWVKE
ncbi:MAG: hypothetical protein ACFB0E_12565 [Leptolyngbyaceae cyanobacterium]